jgi:hypothetical protein
MSNHQGVLHPPPVATALTVDIQKSFQLAFLTPPFLGGISAEVCEISPHNSDFL